MEIVDYGTYVNEVRASVHTCMSFEARGVNKNNAMTHCHAHAHIGKLYLKQFGSNHVKIKFLLLNLLHDSPTQCASH